MITPVIEKLKKMMEEEELIGLIELLEISLLIDAVS